jgi:hypothetical protein
VLSSITIDCPAFDEIELLRVDLAEEAWGDEPFNQSGEAPGWFPRSFDPDATLSPRRVDGEAGDCAPIRIGLGEDAAWLWFVDARLDELLPSAERHRESNLGASTGSTL